MDYYAVLDLKPDCTDDEIKAQYRRLARECHPDVNPDDRARATERLRLINEAYAVLSNPEKRRRYDAMRAAPSWDDGMPLPDARAYSVRYGAIHAKRLQTKVRISAAVAAVLIALWLRPFFQSTPDDPTPVPQSAPAVSTSPTPTASVPPPSFPPTPPAVPNEAQNALPGDQSVSHIASSMDRLQLEVDLVLQHAQDKYDAVHQIGSADPAAVDRLGNDLQLLKSTDDAARSDVDTLQKSRNGPPDQVLVSRAADELQETVLAGRNVVRDVRALNGSTLATP